MEELIINCQTGEETRRKFTVAEIDQRQAESAKAGLDEEKQEREQAKAHLIDASNRLEQAAALAVEKVLDAADVAAIQQEVDVLKVQLVPIKPEPIPLEK